MSRLAIGFLGLVALTGCDKLKGLQGGADATASATAEDAGAATPTPTPTEAPTTAAVTDEAGATPTATTTPTGATPTPVAVATGTPSPQPIQGQPVPTATVQNGGKQVAVDPAGLTLRNDAGTGRVVNNPGGGTTITGKSGKSVTIPAGGGIPGMTR